MTSSEDRLRALDAVEPTDTWTDITRRAEGPVDLPLQLETGSRRSPALLVAAAILVVATIAGAAALAARYDDGGRPVASDGGSSTTQGGVAARPAPASADGFWGRRWTVLERFDVGGVVLPVVDGFQGATPVLDSRDEGTIWLAAGCYGTGANVTIADRRLRITEIMPQAAVKLPCTEGQLAQDQWFGAFLAEGPTVSVEGPRLTLIAASGTRVELVDIEANDGITPTSAVPPGVTGPPAEGNQQSPPLDPGGTSSGSPGTAGPPGGGAPAPTTTFPAIAQQADGTFFNHIWQVAAISDGGSDPGFDGAVVVASRDNKVTVAGCNGAGGAMRLEGDRLRVDGEWSHTMMGCGSADGTDRRMEQDAWFDSFLGDEPTVAVTGRTATLTTSRATVHLRLP